MCSHRDTTTSAPDLHIREGIEMIRLNVQRFGTIRTLALAGLLAIGVAASTTTPPLAQNSGNWNKTGSMNTARENHTATLLQNGQVLVAGGFNNTLTIASA